MFYRLKQFFRFKERRKIVYDNNYEIKLLTIKVESLKDDITLLKKIVKRKETKIVTSPSGIFSMVSDSDTYKEDFMQKEREKLKAEGFSFCHRHPNGNETWAKD